MMKPGRSRAEEQFARVSQQSKKALKEKEALQQEKAALVARLRGLRLAKEASDKEAADRAAAEKATAKSRSGRKR